MLLNDTKHYKIKQTKNAVLSNTTNNYKLLQNRAKIKKKNYEPNELPTAPPRDVLI